MTQGKGTKRSHGRWKMMRLDGDGPLERVMERRFHSTVTHGALFSVSHSDEHDGYDETLVPVDYDKGVPFIRDDGAYRSFVRQSHRLRRFHGDSLSSLVLCHRSL